MPNTFKCGWSLVMLILSTTMVVKTGAEPMELMEAQALHDVMLAIGNGWVTAIEQPYANGGVWHGIVCEDDENIVSLSFGEASEFNRYTKCGPNSTISPAIGQLRHLRKLLFFSCCVRNPLPIPQELEQLSNTLESLVLREHGHNGLIPAGLSQFSELIYLDLHGNYLSSDHGVQMQLLQNKSNLKVLDLNCNELQGSLDSDIFIQAPSLTILDLSHNKLEGPLPPSLGKLERLKKLDLSHNKFWGEVPSTISGLQQLELLDLSRNSLVGALPLSVGSLPLLKAILLEGNSMGAPIAASIGRLRNLQVLVLSSCGIVGEIPQEPGETAHVVLGWERAQWTHTIEPGTADGTL
ncbi:hypothetical protein Mapa_005715 [Marchantia paleacea]|nr:hypothetical protein Mapa_005715 [Marchantia paleacea]